MDKSDTLPMTLEMDLARNMFGRLKPIIKMRIAMLWRRPSHETWDNAFSIIVGSDGWMTLWQAIIAVDPTFPRTGKVSDEHGNVKWSRIPDRKLIEKALRYATH